MDIPRHTIDAVARRTGLTPHVIRIWEKRYQAVEPARSPTNRRQYTEDEIERLALLRELTRAGQSIGYVAKLSTETLRSLVANAAKTDKAAAAIPGAHSRTDPAEDMVSEALAAVAALDTRRLETVLKRAGVVLGRQGLLQRVAAPLAQRLGEQWREGAITAAHEHFATAALRTFLGQSTAAFGSEAGGPSVVVGTPPGQLHELGALLAAALAANLGWRVTYLGASLPAAELAGAALQNGSKVVALSLVYPEDDAQLPEQLTRLRELLPPEVSIVVGGRAAAAYRACLDRIGAFQAADLSALGALLDRVRGSNRS